MYIYVHARGRPYPWSWVAVARTCHGFYLGQLGIHMTLQERVGIRTASHIKSANRCVCCSRADKGILIPSFFLEKKNAGSALTFSQMLFITAQSLPSFLIRAPGQWFPRLKSRQVPLRQWALQVLVLTAGSLLNNWAFAYDVPLTVLIVFRSAGVSPFVFTLLLLV